MAPGPDKTLWGETQREWLKRTLLESDATFQDPDLTDPDGRPRRRGPGWTARGGPRPGQAGQPLERHWQYHSRHPAGFEEFSTGAIIDANSRVGRPPGDPDSNDPNAEIEQLYTYDEPTGGFLRVTVTPGPSPTATFSFFDETGRL